MFNAPYRQLEWGVLGAWAGVLVAAFAFGRLNARRTGYAHRPILMGTSGLLVVLAGLFWLGAARGPALEPFARFIALGMAASFVGDLIMAQYIRTPHRVVFGGVAFVVAHILYILAGTVAAAALGLGREPLSLAAAFLLLGLGLWAVLIRSRQQKPVLNTLMLIYMLVLCTMTGLAIWLASAVPAMWPFAVGAGLFLASDVILLNQIGRQNHWFLVSDVVWLLYITGQALIVSSNWAALGLIQ